ncbi:MAG: hypothetical protein AAGL90_10185 [Pseudomonadota bacterium]
MAQSIKISDEEMELVRREAKLSSRSIAGQITYWMRIGRSIERSPQFTYTHIREALEGRRSPDALTGEEQEVYIEDLLVEAAGQTAEQDAIFAARKREGKGVGLGADGEVTKQAPETPA